MTQHSSSSDEKTENPSATESCQQQEAEDIFLPGDLVKSMPAETLERQKRVHLVSVPDTTEKAPKKSREELARERQKTYLHKRRKQKKRQVFYHRIRQLIKLGCAAFWLVVIWQLSGLNFWLLDQPRLVLLNQQLISQEHIQPLVNKLAGKPVFGIQPADIANQLKEKFPLIDQIYVRRYLFPARVELFVLEKQPWAELYTADTTDTKEPFALLTTDYDIVPLKRYRAHYHKTRYPANSIHKLILPTQNFKPPNKTFLKRLDRLSYKLSHTPGLHFESLIVDSPEMIRARFTETDVMIGRLDTGVFRRTDRLKALTPKILELQDELASVDLRWSEQVTFRRK